MSNYRHTYDDASDYLQYVVIYFDRYIFSRTRDLHTPLKCIHVILPSNVMTRNGFDHDKIDLTRGYLFEYGKTLVNKSAMLDDVDS